MIKKMFSLNDWYFDRNMLTDLEKHCDVIDNCKATLKLVQIINKRISILQGNSELLAVM